MQVASGGPDSNTPMLLESSKLPRHSIQAKHSHTQLFEGQHGAHPPEDTSSSGALPPLPKEEVLLSLRPLRELPFSLQPGSRLEVPALEVDPGVDRPAGAHKPALIICTGSGTGSWMVWRLGKPWRSVTVVGSVPMPCDCAGCCFAQKSLASGHTDMNDLPKTTEDEHRLGKSIP